MQLTPEQEQRRREGITKAHARHREEAAEHRHEMRQCTKCKEYKNVGLFYVQKTYTKAGEVVLRPMSWCRRCVRRSQQAKRRLQKEQLA
jgi:hypothetical protein